MLLIWQMMEQKHRTENSGIDHQAMDEHHWCFKWQGLLLAQAILLLPGWFSKIIF